MSPGEISHWMQAAGIRAEDADRYARALSEQRIDTYPLLAGMLKDQRLEQPPFNLLVGDIERLRDANGIKLDIPNPDPTNNVVNVGGVTSGAQQPVPDPVPPTPEVLEREEALRKQLQDLQEENMRLRKQTAGQADKKGLSMAQGKASSRSGRPEKKFPCQVEGCNLAYTTLSNVRRHENRDHKNPGIRPFRCDKCSKAWHNKQEYHRHLLKVHEQPVQEKTRKCLSCVLRHKTQQYCRDKMKHTDPPYKKEDLEKHRTDKTATTLYRPSNQVSLPTNPETPGVMGLAELSKAVHQNKIADGSMPVAVSIPVVNDLGQTSMPMGQGVPPNPNNENTELPAKKRKIDQLPFPSHIFGNNEQPPSISTAALPSNPAPIEAPPVVPNEQQDTVKTSEA